MCSIIPRLDPEDHREKLLEVYRQFEWLMRMCRAVSRRHFFGHYAQKAHTDFIGFYQTCPFVCLMSLTEILRHSSTAPKPSAQIAVPAIN